MGSIDPIAPAAPLWSRPPLPLSPDEPVSVAVVNWNGEAYLAGCLRSILDQSLRPAEVRVFDNASTDSSVDLVAREFPSVAVTRLPENRGPGPARNEALHSAGTRLLLLVDND